ncbi:MAG: GntR family transcriptional regulator [Lachnotalea sp.]
MYQFENFENISLTNQIEDNVLSYIMDNKIEVGTKLPNEFELAKMFGVGRSTCRKLGQETIKIHRDIAEAISNHNT